ncbi:MAG: excinuclease ABC subunit B [Chloroflexi bacterium]|nr:excinuclease ABC subunit B [Chloroflexota bacterium]|tara:strand:+ start:776 stop:2842 length:2067 start_codon:yes stop_codon:yes gene_type:complete
MVSDNTIAGYDESVPFKIISDFSPTGDQPKAINNLVNGLQEGMSKQVLLGVTGSGKTFTMAKTIEKMQKPALVMAPNKTLAAQLATEFREFFPHNAVEYFVSYYDYYQPEAYVPQTDTYIEKDASINEHIDKLRLSATRSLLSRKDVIIVASVSCIYGLGDPHDYQSFVLTVSTGDKKKIGLLIRQLIGMQYDRNDMDLARGRFRLKGDIIDLIPAYQDFAVRIQFWGDEIEKIQDFDQLTGEVLRERESVELYPAKHFVTPEEKLLTSIGTIRDELDLRLNELRIEEKLLEVQRLESRTNFDLEMLQQLGYCSGIENYSRHLSQRSKGSAPWTLLDYFPDDFLVFLDESHMTLPQLHGMYRGDMSRKTTLVEYGFRLPSALDNRPLNYDEFTEKVNQIVYVSATPGEFELKNSESIVEQVIRPTGLLDPVVEVRPTIGQIDDLLEEIRDRIRKKQRCLITTLTKRMAEELAEYLLEMKIKTAYLHSDLDTLERTDRLRDLRFGIYDVVVGINLLREGLDLPEVSLIAILDADKEGYLRSQSALIQTIGRAARHVEGHVIMYADKLTRSMNLAINETNRRREIQMQYNVQHNIEPIGISKSIKDITDRVREISGFNESSNPKSNEPLVVDKAQIANMIKDLERDMKKYATQLEFEKAALIRDQIKELRNILIIEDDDKLPIMAIEENK